MLSSSAPSHSPPPLQISGHHNHRSQTAGLSSSSTQDGSPGRASSMSSPGSPQSADSYKNDYPWGNYQTHEEPEEYHHSPSPSRSGTTSTTSPLLIRGRTVSDGSAHVSASASAKAARHQKKNVNAHSYCGRHSSEYLFGGRGFGDLWRAVHPPKNGKRE